MGDEVLGKEGAVNKIMTVITKPDSVADTQAEECDGQTKGASREQDTEGETEGSSRLCPIVRVNTAAAREVQRHIAAAGSHDVSENTRNIKAESQNKEEAKENKGSTGEPESQQDRSKYSSLFS